MANIGGVRAMDIRWKAYLEMQQGTHRNKEDMLTELLKAGVWRNMRNTKNYKQVIRRIAGRVKGAKGVRYRLIEDNFSVLQGCMRNYV